MTIFSGVWPALVTPSNPDQTINLGSLYALIDYLIDKGVHGFYAGGTTGEGVFMALADRRKLVEAALRHINGRVPVIVHVGAVATADAEALARHARDNGAVAISSIIPPLYESEESIRRYYSALGAATPDIPLLAYLLNPRLDGVALMRRLLEIPNLGGAKYTGPNMYELRNIVELGGGKWTLFSGMDEQAIFGLMMGATGTIGSTINAFPGVYLAIYKAAQAGDYAEARDLQLRVNRVTRAMIAAGFSGALRMVLADMLKAETGDPRPPALPLGPEGQKLLRASLAQTDFAKLIAL
ncbi:MAG: dihydrodipicolinate synthase family protein [Anaerolineae bacterium]|nr:dihydrodipicolinate synthase family protein [Anaerolineae bacterium]